MTGVQTCALPISNTFFYADPPYDVNQSQSYRTDLSSVTPEKIATNFQHIKGKVLISFNDSSEIRKEFTSRGYYVFPIEVKYTSNPFNQHKRPELLITNFPLKL